MPSRRSYYFLAIAVLPLLLFLQRPQISEPVRSLSLTVLKPVFLAGETVTDIFRNTQGAFLRFWKAFGDQEKLETRIAFLESELLRFQEFAKENERLQKLLQFRSSESGRSVAARIIGWDPTPWKKTVILDKGTSQGIQKDMAVLVPEGLVGRVIEAGPTTARAILLTDPDSRVSAITETSRSQGILMGDGSPKIKMTYLELEGGAAVEERIITSGVGGVFPKGIRMGKIVALEKDADGLHLVAEVESFVRFSKLEEVLCLASSQPRS